MRFAHSITALALSTPGLSQASALGASWHPSQQSDAHQHVLEGQQRQRPGFPRWPGPLSSSSLRPHERRPRTGFVALGDSYSAGIGTGVDGPENDCRQGIHAYPALIFRDLSASQGGPNTTSFQFLSCTGATTNEILAGRPESQLDALNGTLPADFALLSVGGNDLGFFEVMNACIFRFYNFYSGTCETALQHAQDRLSSSTFEEDLYIVILELLDKVKWEKKPVGRPLLFYICLSFERGVGMRRRRALFAPARPWEFFPFEPSLMRLCPRSGSSSPSPATRASSTMRRTTATT